MATLDEDPRSRSNEIEKSYQMRAIKLDPWPRRVQDPKGAKLRLNLHGTFWRELVQTKKKNKKQELI
jgi:hypothetical protein